MARRASADPPPGASCDELATAGCVLRRRADEEARVAAVRPGLVEAVMEPA
jgi:hypothetical protein